MKSKTLKPVLVTTAHRGVFFGYVEDYDVGQKTIQLQDARMCVYWSAAMKGVGGLAAVGPDTDCKIAPRVASHMLNDITSIASVEPDAAEKWEQAPWG